MCRGNVNGTAYELMNMDTLCCLLIDTNYHLRIKKLALNTHTYTSGSYQMFDFHRIIFTAAQERVNFKCRNSVNCCQLLTHTHTHAFAIDGSDKVHETETITVFISAMYLQRVLNAIKFAV